MNLEILIITYNRALKLKETLNYFIGSVLQDYPITIFDNCSTDNTRLVVEGFKEVLINLNYCKNRVNVGGNANILRAIEHSNSEYTWVVCDDDILDFSEFSDVLDVIHLKEVNLIHVGGHFQKNWKLGGVSDTPKRLLERGYPYFKFSSFLPTNIFRTKLFQDKYLVPGYNNIGNSYPHMPYLIGIYERNENVYISQKQIVTATLGGQAYSVNNWMTWWMNTSKLFDKTDDVRRIFFDQWNNIDEDGKQNALSDLYLHYITNKGNYEIKSFIRRYLTKSEQLLFVKKRATNAIKKMYRIAIQRQANS